MLQKIRELIAPERSKTYKPMYTSSNFPPNKPPQQNLQNRPLTQEEIENIIREWVQIDIRIIDKNNVLAAADLIILKSVVGTISIKGFLIFRSSRENPALKANINITPPSKKIITKYSPQVFFGNRERWNFLQKLIYEKYLSVKEEQLKRSLS